MSGLIAIVGRPNVGKSALFNRIVKKRIAIVHDQPGVTRDRVSVEAEWHGRPYTLVDTGGIGLLRGEKSDDVIIKAAVEQVEIAIESANVIILVVNVQEGVVPLDNEVAQRLRKSGKPVLVAVNKVDTARAEKGMDEFARLGFEKIFPVSAIHGEGIENLMNAAAAFLPVQSPTSEVQSPQAGEAPTSSSQLPASFTELCSVGLAFKLAHAILKRGRETGLPGAAEFDLKPLLDLVALGTIADLVPLTGENRILVTAGLEKLNTTTRPGIVALKEVAQSPEKIGVVDVGFQLAPRLNASGRLETAEESLHLLLAETLDEALPLAQNLDARNRERQKIEKTIVEEVTGVVRSKFDAQKDFVIVEGQLLWHIGVVGIVASRVLSEFYRPTIILGGDAGEWRGSGRSIVGFDLAAALRECGDLLVKHGGHAMAAGLTIAPDKIDLFRQRMNSLAQRSLTPENFQPPLRLDAEVDLNEISLDSLAELEKLKPTGQGNPALQFCARNLAHKKPLQRMGVKKQHVKMWVTDGTVTHEAVWWNAGEGSLPVGRFDLAFAPSLNDYNGRTTVQLKVLDWRAVEI